MRLNVHLNEHLNVHLRKHVLVPCAFVCARVCACACFQVHAVVRARVVPANEQTRARAQADVDCYVWARMNEFASYGK